MTQGTYGRMQDETEDILNGNSGLSTVSTTQRGKSSVQLASKPSTNGSANGLDESQFATGEIAGDALVTTVGTETAEAGDHDELGNTEATESGEEYIEATPEQLAAAESGEETAVSDLRGIEGFESVEAAGEAGESALREVGEAIEGGQEEFLPILAALVPTLISTIGPVVAKGVMSRLSPRATSLIKRLPQRTVGTAVKGVARSAGTSSIFALIAKLLETAEQAPTKAGGESGVAVDETFLQEAAAAIEVIIGSDDRVRVMQTTNVPWRRICALRIHFPSGATYRGTGFLIGPRAVATAGHCVYLHNQGGWARKIEVIPGCNGSSHPYGQVVSTSFRSVGGWVTGKKPESDYGCIVLPAGAFPQNLGSFGFAAFDAPMLLAQPAVLAGYPGDKPFAEMWGMRRRIKAVTAKTLIYDTDTVAGQSGAPVYIKRNGQRFVIGIHNYGATTGNSATRVTQRVYERLLAWSKIS